MVFITDKGLLCLKQYQYKSGGYSWLDNKINYFWIACVEMVPKWVAPNLLTFIGFVFMISSCFISISYDFSLTQVIPRWTFLYAALSIFIYQTLDAIDGKQARRTNSSSPLGQLFDHGCDSFVMTFFLLQLAQASQMDKEYLFYVFLGIQIVLWGTNQKEHHTGILHTHKQSYFVCQFNWYGYNLYKMITYFYGQEFWQFSIYDFFPSLTTNILGLFPFAKFLQIPFYRILVFIILPTAYLAGIYTFVTNLLIAEHKVRLLLEWVQIIVIWCLQFIWFSQSVYAKMAGPILINFGVVLSLIVCKLIVCSTTKDKYQLFHLETLPLIFATLFVYFFQSILSETQIIGIFWLNFVVTLYMSLYFIKGVIKEITGYLGISCFSLKKKIIA